MPAAARQSVVPLARPGFTLVELTVVIAICALLAGLLLSASGAVREFGRRVRCGKQAGQLVVAQNSYAAQCAQRGLPDVYVRGVEGFTGPGYFDSDMNARTNPSRAMLWLARKGFFDGLAGLACPSDPFLAVLDGDAGKLRPEDRDLHGGGPLVEGTPVPSAGAWASPRSAAVTETGHTFFSYSMQAGNMNRMIGPNPLMSSRLPLFSDRNPWCEGVAAASGGAVVSQPDLNPEGNTFNHGREGQTVAFADGRVGFADSARSIEIPLTPRPGAAIGYDYLYDARAPSPNPKTVTTADGRCPPTSVNGASRSPNMTAWLVD